MAKTQLHAQISPPSDSTDPAPRQVLTPVVVANSKLWNWKGLRRCFSQRDGFILVEGYESPEQLLVHCQRMAPCVVIADQALLERFDPAEFASMVDYGRSVQVLAYGPARDDRVVQNLVRMGCMGFVTEGTSPAILKKAARALARGEMWIDRRLLTRVLQQLLFANRSPKLTPREKDILKLIARGYKNRAIAERLCISHETVRWHIRGLHSKLGLQDRLGTAMYAQQYLDDDTPYQNAS
ncbi:MAG: response regulator transcription factor [Bryobacteraceae bacterium]